MTSTMVNMRKPNRMIRVATTAAAILLVLMVAAPAGAATNDPYFSRLWGLQRVGAEHAWSATRGSNVLIAVIDSGVDLAHPDLQGKLTPGRDFIDGDGSPMDVNGHGTLVAGIAAAVTNNGAGIASVAPDALIMPVRVFDSSGQADPETAAEAIRWSVDEAQRRGMKLVLNLSFVGGGEGGVLSDIFTPSVDREIRAAASRGAAVVAAAGNEGRGETAYDSGTAGVAVVGGTDSNDRRAMSNYGAGLDVMAPGVDIISTYWNRGQSSYASGSGTSMSVAFVSGTAALLMSRGMSNSEAMKRIFDSAEDLGAPGRDNEFGFGLLDVAKATGVSRTPVENGGNPPPPGGGGGSSSRRTNSPPPAAPPSSPPPLVLPSPGEPPAIPEQAPAAVSVVTPTQTDSNVAAKAESRYSDPATTFSALGLLLTVIVGHVARRRLFL